jgi:hypothetical protein
VNTTVPESEISETASYSLGAKKTSPISTKTSNKTTSTSKPSNVSAQKILFYIPDAYITTPSSSATGSCLDSPTPAQQNKPSTLPVTSTTNSASACAVAAKVAMSMSLVMSDMDISHVGDSGLLQSLCGMHVMELDVSKNAFSDWSEVCYLTI